MSTTTNSSLEALFTPRAKKLVPPVYGAAEDEHSPVISLRYGLADPASFPHEELVTTMASMFETELDGALNYGPPSGELVEQLVQRMRDQGVEATPENMLISYGSGQVLALLPSLFIEPGDVAIVEGPSFLGAVRRFAREGANLITVPTDAQGMDVDALEVVLRDLQRKGTPAKFIYTIPTFHNPTGVTMPLERRKKLVSLGAEYHVVIVEDDAYGDLRFEGAALPTLAALDSEGWVMRVSTFSKILAPGMRVGWVYARPEIIARLAMFRSEGASGPFVTRLVARYCADGRLDRHISLLIADYRHKRDTMLQAVQREFPDDVTLYCPEGGFFLWCKLPADIDADALEPVAHEHGVAFLPGTNCYVNGEGSHALRLAFSYQSAERIEEGIGRLGAAMRQLRG